MRKSHLSSTKPFSLREGANFSDAIFFQEIKSLVRGLWTYESLALWMRVVFS
ncbi:17492_t:CDS:2 [Rhizophagus irregularis]|nr:17492_t:CDS:2 [Rhizophagus irregularis]